MKTYRATFKEKDGLTISEIYTFDPTKIGNEDPTIHVRTHARIRANELQAKLVKLVEI